MAVYSGLPEIHLLVMLLGLLSCPSVQLRTEGRKSLVCFALVLVELLNLLCEGTVPKGGRIRRTQATVFWVLVSSLIYGPKSQGLAIL